MQVIQHITMDFTVHGITPKIYGKQDDSGSMRAVAISLYSSGAAYPLTEKTGFMLRYKTAAGAIGLYDVLPDGSSAFSVDGNTVTVKLVDQIFARAGNVECELRVIEASGAVSTWTWIVEVERSNVGDATIPSDYINVLSGYAAAAVQAAAEAKAAAGSIDTASLMKLADYDASGAVKAAGGIADYIRTNAPKVEVINSVESESETAAGSAAAVKLAYDIAKSAVKNELEDGSTLTAEITNTGLSYSTNYLSHKIYGKLHVISATISATATTELTIDEIIGYIKGLEKYQVLCLGSAVLTIFISGFGGRYITVSNVEMSGKNIYCRALPYGENEITLSTGDSISLEIRAICIET